MINRSEIKREAKGILGTARVSPLLIAAIVLAVQFLLSRILDLVENGSLFFSYSYTQYYYEAIITGDYDALLALAASAPESTMTSVFFSVLVNLFTIVLTGGFYLYCMGIRQGAEMPASTLLDGLSVAGKLIWCYIQMTVRIFLWTLLFLIPGLIATYRYRFALYNILTDSSLSASEAIALSCQQTAGMKMDLFILDLSFIGWGIVSSLTFGLLNIWLMPYQILADLAYFEEAQHRLGRSPYGGASGNGPYDGGSYGGSNGTPWEF